MIATIVGTTLIGLVIGGLFMLGAGVLIGHWLGRQSAPKPDESAQTQQVLQHLSQLTESLSGDCSNHNRLMRAVAAEVDRLGDSADASTLRQVLDELNATNRDLRIKLGQMHHELEGKSLEVLNLVSESRTDAMTGLPNRRCFDENILHRISELSRYGGELSFVILDVDHFKKFNDTYGHLLGDAVLKAVANIMLQTVRESDVPTRLGGEEFGVLMPAVGLGEAARAAERLRQAIEKCSVEFEGQPLRVSASIGVTQVQAHDHPEHVIERADQALYAAKEAGRNAVWLWENESCRAYLKSKDPLANVPAEMRKSGEILRQTLLAAVEQ